MSTHTPGPWRVVNVPGEASHIVSPDNFTVVRQGYVSAMDTANANLIAAAPELLRVLKTLELLLRDRSETSHLLNVAMEQAREAIAKSEGAL